MNAEESANWARLGVWLQAMKDRLDMQDAKLHQVLQLATESVAMARAFQKVFSMVAGENPEDTQRLSRLLLHGYQTEYEIERVKVQEALRAAQVRILPEDTQAAGGPGLS